MNVSFLEKLLNFVPSEIIENERTVEMTINLTNQNQLIGFYSALDQCYNNKRIANSILKQVHIVREPFTNNWRFKDRFCNCPRPGQLIEKDILDFEGKITFNEADRERHLARPISNC